MSRPRLTLTAASIATALVAAAILASVAIGADEILVRSGDTLIAIARRHDLTVERLVDLNDLADPNRIFAGQRLRLEPAEEPPPAAQPPAAPASSRIHTVRAGEHLTGIARAHGTTIAEIAAANGLADPSRIFVGQRLTIPGAAATAPAATPAGTKPARAPAPAASAPSRVHTVRAGEHLTGIARAHGTTIAEIAAANGLADPSRIFAGQRLTIPGAAATAASPAAPAVTTAASMPPSMAALVAERDAVRRIIVDEAKRFGVPPAFALAVAWQESGWQQRVVSWAGAVGVMQLLPATSDWVGETMLGTTVDPGDTRQNVRAGVRLLAHYLDRYDGNRNLVLAAYYQGQTAADRHGVFAVSRPYIASIKVLETLFGG